MTLGDNRRVSLWAADLECEDNRLQVSRCEAQRWAGPASLTQLLSESGQPSSSRAGAVPCVTLPRLHWAGCFPVAVLKHQGNWQKGFNLAHGSRGTRVPHGGRYGSRQPGNRTGKLRAHAFHGKQEPERPDSHWCASSSKAALPGPPQTWLPTGDQVLQSQNHGGHFSFKLLYLPSRFTWWYFKPQMRPYLEIGLKRA